LDMTEHHSVDWREFVAKHGRLERRRPAVAHLLQGLALSMVPPLGWFLILTFTGAELGHDVVEHGPLYAYLFLSTALAFSMFGWILGRKEKLLNHLIVQLDHQSVTDPLTRLYNRRYFFERVEEQCERSVRAARPFALAILDLDHFKDLNDRFGHLVGDRVLVAVSQVLSAHVRRSEVFARIGGEEFGLLFPQSDEAEALAAVERLLDALEVRVAEATGVPGLPDVTASVGIVFTGRLEESPDSSQIMAAADSALYRAKDLGRNRAVSWTAVELDKNIPESV
jgi:diguanylate cyclase (GGDEF)-like protein